MLLDQETAERHAHAGEHDQILGEHRGVDRITQGGLGEFGPAPLEKLTSALKVTGRIHGGDSQRHEEGQHGRGRVIPGNMDDESRIVELELRYMQQQELLQELSEVLYAQGRELEGLRVEVALMKKKLEGEPGLVDAQRQEKPPHY
ncbi:SlyX-like protein [Cystobacter fuscus DSM 2262]|uniref:SlyX-like protein n=2 Tax=Cystobacter fuscus TaxID=43 RepID=S9QTI1_CYSF2|nr:SlyX-like protein [Cystobacter fuscus DSM 2262]